VKVRPVEALSAESQALYHAVNNEPDFPCVLIVTSFLDQCLGALLERFFVQGQVSAALLSGAIGRFSTRAQLCFALGLIPEALLKNLLTIGAIRNRFAHSYLSLTFDDPEVTRQCESLTFPIVAEGVSVDGETGVVCKPNDPWWRFRDPRDKFTIVAVMMAGRLQLYALGTDHRRPQDKGWS
jgi:hypothetical protein